MKKRDEITKLIKSLEDMDGEGYNGKYDPAFEQLIKSLVEETKQGAKFVDVLGFVPGAGEPADALNALISLLRGNYVDAGLSAAAVLPIGGWAATARKYAKRAAKAVNKTEDVLKHTDDIVDAGQAVARYTDDAADLSDAAVKQLEDQLVYNWYNSKEPDILGNNPKVNAEGMGETSKIPWDSWQNYEKVTQNGQTYAKVGDRLYSEHAVNRMQPSGNRFGINIYEGINGKDYVRSIAPQYVEDVISSTKPVYQPRTGNYSYALGNVEVIDAQGAVVTILTYK